MSSTFLLLKNLNRSKQLCLNILGISYGQINSTSCAVFINRHMNVFIVHNMSLRVISQTFVEVYYCY